MAVYVRMFGGLGNQLFIYAFGRAMALRNNDDLFVDAVSGFANDFYRRVFALDVYDVKFDPARGWYSRSDYLGRIVRKVEYLIAARSPLGESFVVLEESPPRFQSAVRQLQTNGRGHVFEGYWQSPRYFDDYAQQIRQDLSVVAPLDDYTRKTEAHMAGVDAIGVHARRLHGVPAGLEHQGAAEGIKQIPLSYYNDAVIRMASGLKNPHLYCFGDARDWVREHFRFDVPMTVVEGKGGDQWAYQDLYLMSKCKRFAVANSSFSWWGAWLMPDPQKQVYYPAPAHWNWTFNQDMIPKDWLAISC